MDDDYNNKIIFLFKNSDINKIRNMMRRYEKEVLKLHQADQFRGLNIFFILYVEAMIKHIIYVVLQTKIKIFN